jgi:hypothetical protein
MTTRLHWVFKNPCGCPVGVLDVSEAGTRSKAWREFYGGAKDRNAAVDRGVTVDQIDHDTYVADVMPMLYSSYTCPHGGA